jgi:hypothetical protein
MLRAPCAGVTSNVIPLSPTTSVRIDLVALEPSGPYRLTVDHPATHLVEYFTSPLAAIDRWNEIAAVFSARRHDEELPPAA